MFGDAGVESGGCGDRRVLLLDQPFGQANEGCVFLGAIALDEVPGVLLRVAGHFAFAQGAQLPAQEVIFAAGSRLAHVQAHQGFLEFDVMQLHPGVLVERRVMSG